ncbi:hypothetical protein E1B28_007250 [Marasmius oreades]|uniref:RING-type E3 ubiquitin transferase n=1 Tax=Marasmius oreades TaxID=181124 RepID=A0A9P7S1C5_9AGAR|nr:uncharacterized protein E1B28_007250 [Marasmius oreades]KAG7093584.1 hypothetical protein E1B28_007250 [Marasmius oreades]
MSNSKEICTFFLKNACNKGDRCLYRHDRASTGTTVPCPYFKLGTCKFGDSCLNRHEREGSLKDLDASNTRAPCKYFTLGKCRHGDHCLYDHGIKGPSSSLSTSSFIPAILNTTSASSDTFVEHSNPPQQPITPLVQNLPESPNGPMAVIPELIPLPPSRATSPEPASPFGDRRDDDSQTSVRTSGEQLNGTNDSEINPGSSSPLPHLTYQESSPILSIEPYPTYQQGLYPAYSDYRLPVHYPLPISPTILSPMPPLQPQFFQPIKKDATVPLCQQHFEKNACLYTNETCHFRHILSANEYKALSQTLSSMDPLTPNINGSTKKCLFYEAGKCRNGDACPYVHEVHGQAVAPKMAIPLSLNDNEDLRDDTRNSATTSEPFRTTGFKRKVCHYYQQAKCRNGDRCKYTHEKEPLSDENPGASDNYGWGGSGDDRADAGQPAAEDNGWTITDCDWTSDLPPEVPQISVWDTQPSDEGADADNQARALEAPISGRISALNVESESNEGDNQTPAPTQGQSDDAATWDQDWGNQNPSQLQREEVDNRKELPCKYFGQGHCNWGDECPFQHIRQEEYEHMQVPEEHSEKDPEIEDIESIETPPDTRPSHPIPSAEQSFFHCRVRFGPGGVPEEVTTPFESHTVVISHLPLAITSQQIEELDRLVSSFGTIDDQTTETIDDAVQVRIDYSSIPDAAVAARSLNNYQFHSSILTARVDSPSPIVYNIQPAKDSCWVKIAYPTPYRRAWCFYRTITQAKQEVNRLDGRTLRGRKVKASFQSRLASRRNHNAFAICLDNLPLRTEKDDLKGFCDGPMLVEITSPNYNESPLEDIRRLLDSFGDIQLFELVPSSPSKSKQLAFARFHDANAAVLAVQKLNGTEHEFIGGSVLTVQLTYYSCFEVPSQQLAIIEREIERIRDSRFEECKIQWDAEGDTTHVRVFSPKAQALARTMKEIRVLLYGEAMLVPEDSQPFWVEYFDTVSCQKALRNVNRDASFLIQLDFRNRHVLLFGSEEARSSAKAKLLGLVKKVDKMRYSLNLRGPGIRTLLDGGLEILEKSGINSNKMVLDVTSRMFSLWGGIDEFQKVVQVVGQCESDPPTTKMSASCPICRLPPFKPIELSCCHVYCDRCISYYIQSRTIPPFEKLVCLASAQDDDELPPYPCTNEIPLSVIGNLLSPEETLDLLETSFLAHVQKNPPAKFRMCPTIDCRLVYRITEEDTVIRCPECKLFICSSCNVVSHDGLTCSEYRQIDVSHT